MADMTEGSSRGFLTFLPEKRFPSVISHLSLVIVAKQKRFRIACSMAGRMRIIPLAHPS
jgi:hypothetical protein